MPKQYGAIEQNQLIERSRKRATNLQIFLKNGVPIRGKVVAHDSHSIFLSTDQGQVLVYKHAISSLASGKGPMRGTRPKPQFDTNRSR